MADHDLAMGCGFMLEAHRPAQPARLYSLAALALAASACGDNEVAALQALAAGQRITVVGLAAQYETTYEVAPRAAPI